MNNEERLIRLIKRLLLVLFLLVAVKVTAVSASEFDHGVWDGLLQSHVEMTNQGQASQVDYRAFLQKRTELRTYLSQLSAVRSSEFLAWSKSEQLAFLINETLGSI